MPDASAFVVWLPLIGGDRSARIDHFAADRRALRAAGRDGFTPLQQAPAIGEQPADVQDLIPNFVQSVKGFRDRKR